jgi:hypothetical protein
MKPIKLAFAKVGGVDSTYVLVLGSANPPDAEWALWVDYIATHIQPGTAPRVVVVTEGGSPTAAQRGALSDVTARYKDEARVVVCTESTIARGALTALSWFLPDVYRAFSPADFDKALKYLGLTSAADEIKSTVRELQNQLGIPGNID